MMTNKNKNYSELIHSKTNKEMIQKQNTKLFGKTQLYERGDIFHYMKVYNISFVLSKVI